MFHKISRKSIKAFFTRRKLNGTGLLLLTLLSAAVTVFAAVFGFRRIRVFLFVTVCLVLLCLFYAWKSRSSFRTLPHFRALSRKHRIRHQKQDK